MGTGCQISSAAQGEPPMPIYSISIFFRQADKAHVLSRREELSSFSFLWRSKVAEFVRFGSRQAAQHVDAGAYESIVPDEQNDKLQYVCHSNGSADGLFVATMVTDMDYPARTVYRLINQLLVLFSDNYRQRIVDSPNPISKDLDLDFPPLAEFLANYQDPQSADVAFQIMQDLDQTKEVMYKTIDQVIKRGESLESIMSKSEDLSGASMKFYKTSKKTKCCTIL